MYHQVELNMAQYLYILYIIILRSEYLQSLFQAQRDHSVCVCTAPQWLQEALQLLVYFILCYANVKQIPP